MTDIYQSTLRSLAGVFSELLDQLDAGAITEDNSTIIAAVLRPIVDSAAELASMDTQKPDI